MYKWENETIIDDYIVKINLFKKLRLAIKNKDITQIRKDIEEYILLFGFIFTSL